MAIMAVVIAIDIGYRLGVVVSFWMAIPGTHRNQSTAYTSDLVVVKLNLASYDVFLTVWSWMIKGVRTRMF